MTNETTTTIDSTIPVDAVILNTDGVNASPNPTEGKVEVKFVQTDEDVGGEAVHADSVTVH